MGRKLNGNLPVNVQNSDFSDSDHIREELQCRQNLQKEYFDRKSKDLPPLIPGQDIRFQNNQSGQWEKAKVLSKCEEPRSYVVETPEGQIMRRNRVHLRESPQPSPKKHVRFSNQYLPNSYPNPCDKNVPATVVEGNNPECSTKDASYTTRSGRLIRKPDKMDL